MGREFWRRRRRRGRHGGCEGVRGRGLSLHGAKLFAQSFYFLHQGGDFVGGGSRRVRSVIVGGLGGLEERGCGRLRQVRRSGCKSFRKCRAPEVGGRFGEFELDVITRSGIVAPARDLGDDFALGLLIGEEEKLTALDGNGKANHAAVGKNQRGGSGFGEEFALAGVLSGARTGGHDRCFVSDGSAVERRRGACGRRTNS